MSHTTGTVGQAQQAAFGERNIQQSVNVTNSDLMVQIELLRGQVSRMESAILIINTTRDRLWFAIIGIIVMIVVVGYMLDRQAAYMWQDVRDLTDKVELLERRINLMQ